MVKTLEALPFGELDEAEYSQTKAKKATKSGVVSIDGATVYAGDKGPTYWGGTCCTAT